LTLELGPHGITVNAIMAGVTDTPALRKIPGSDRMIEMAQAKNFLAGSFTRGLETQEGVAEAILHGVLHRLPPEYLDRHVAQVQAVTPDQALAAAQKYVRDGSAVIVAVGDAAKIKEALAKFSEGPVQLVNIDGD